MLNLLKRIYQILDRDQKNKLISLQILVLLMALSEMLGIALVGPFVASFNDTSPSNWLRNALAASDIGISIQTLGIILLFILLLSASLSMYVVWRLSLYAQELGASFSASLFNYYLNKPWLYHTSTNSSFLIKQIATEANRVTGAVLFPLMQLIAKIVVIIFITIALFALNPIFSVSAALCFIIIYSALFIKVRMSLMKNGRTVSETTNKRFKLMTEGFGGVKNIIISGKSNYFTDAYDYQSRKYGIAQGTNLALSQAPRYFMEFLALGSIVGALLISLNLGEESIVEFAPIAAAYGFAGLKLLPAFQQTFAYLAQIKGNMSAFFAIEDDLLEARNQDDVEVASAPATNTKTSAINLQSGLSLKIVDLSFRYPDADKQTLDRVSIEVKSNSIVALVGGSGAGKSTLVDVILGLLPPQFGTLSVNSVQVRKENLGQYQNLIGYVPQKIFLNDCSISENIAFGVNRESINLKLLDKAVKLAKVDEFSSSLPNGLDTMIGEGGVKLSGGQQQRIGIARALYRNPSILVLDEATSALDNVTEKEIIRSLMAQPDKPTIILVAHRLSTVVNCDEIYYLEGGRISDNGKYEDLMKRCGGFRTMVQAGFSNVNK